MHCTRGGAFAPPRLDVPPPWPLDSVFSAIVDRMRWGVRDNPRKLDSLKAGMAVYEPFTRTYKHYPVRTSDERITVLAWYQLRDTGDGSPPRVGFADTLCRQAVLLLVHWNQAPGAPAWSLLCAYRQSGGIGWAWAWTGSLKPMWVKRPMNEEIYDFMWKEWTPWYVKGTLDTTGMAEEYREEAKKPKPPLSSVDPDGVVSIATHDPPDLVRKRRTDAIAKRPRGPGDAPAFFRPVEEYRINGWPELTAEGHVLVDAWRSVTGEAPTIFFANEKEPGR